MKKITNQGIVLIALSGLLAVGITVGLIRHSRRGKIEVVLERQEELKLDLNQAGVDELTLLPGIGGELASRIVSYREEHGDFVHVESLVNVEGIAEQKLARIKPYLEVR